MDAVHAAFVRQTTDGTAAIARERVDIAELRVVHSVDMQFIGQTHLLRVPLPNAEPTREDLQTLFEDAYFRRFQVSLPEIRPALVNVNTSVIGRRPEIDLSLLIDHAERRATLAEAQTGTRKVWFAGWIDTPIYWRDHLPMDATLTGPVIVEQMDCTLVIEPGDTATQDADGNLIVTLGKDMK
jgi:N-methylhydantoinase A